MKRFMCRVCPALFAGLMLGGSCASVAAESPADLARLLAHADEIKTSNHAEFLAAVRTLDERLDALSPAQQAYLRYLHAYQLSYSGDYEGAIPPLKAIIAESEDVTLRFRASVTLTNILALSAHYDDAYAHLNDLLELQQKIPDKQTRLLGFGIAALLYNQAGQYELGLDYAEKWIADDKDGTGACKGTYLKIESLYRTDRLAGDKDTIARGIEACTRIGDPVAANLIRTFAANVAIARQGYADALELLRDNYDDVQRTQYARLTSEVDSILARIHLMQGEIAQARRYAQSAVDKSVKNEITKPLVDAYEVLYEVAKREGDIPNALAYHEKYAAVDKGYLNDTTARTLAYQMVNQQVLDKKRQIDALNARNQVLELEGEVASKAAETQSLYVTLLVCGLTFIALWAYRTKRSQVKFQKLARRDGLTGIVNRHHFMDEAKALLQYNARSARDVSMILIDLDNFKSINDTFGHVAGDGVLKETVATCQQHMRSVDLFGRLGGEEFGVLLPDCGLEAASKRAEQLRAAIAGIVNSGVEIRVSASFGVTSARESGYDLRQMLIHADSALYLAKREGRNRVETFAPPAVDATAPRSPGEMPTADAKSVAG